MSTDIAERLRALAHEHQEGRLDLTAYRALRGPLLDSLASGVNAPAMETTQPRVAHRQMNRDAITRPGKPHKADAAASPEPLVTSRRLNRVAVWIAAAIVVVIAAVVWVWVQQGRGESEQGSSSTAAPPGAARNAVEEFMDAGDWSDGRIAALNATLMELGGEQIAPLTPEAGFQRFVDELRRRLKEQQALSPTALTVDNSPLAALAVTVGLDLKSPDSELHIVAAPPVRRAETEAEGRGTSGHAAGARPGAGRSSDGGANDGAAGTAGEAQQRGAAVAARGPTGADGQSPTGAAANGASAANGGTAVNGRAVTADMSSAGALAPSAPASGGGALASGALASGGGALASGALASGGGALASGPSASGGGALASGTSASGGRAAAPGAVAAANSAATGSQAPTAAAAGVQTTADDCRRERLHSRRPLCQDTLPTGAEGPVMALIPAGAFEMGSTEAPEEQPVHHVTIGDAFAVSVYEVSQGEFKQYCDATRRPCPTQPWSGDDYPVVNVSWDEARGYVEWLTTVTHHRYTLPTESQWEYAARAGSTGLYPSGTALSPTDANFSMLKKQTVAARRSQKFNANAFRLMHTVGNVREWVEDPWTQTYAGAPSDGTAMKSTKPAMRVARGGSYMDGSTRLRLSMREGIAPDTRDVTTGFRIVRELQ